MLEFVLDNLENIVGKGENADYDNKILDLAIFKALWMTN